MGTVAVIRVPDPPALSATPDGAATEGQAYTLTMPSLATEALRITSRDGRVFTWAPTEMAYRGVDAAGAPHLDYIVGSAPVSVSLDGKAARYARLFPDSEDVFLPGPEQVKHWTIVNKAPRAPAVYLDPTKQAVEFGVAGLVTGAQLPVGEHESIEVPGFRLPPPVAKALDGAEVTGRYEVLDTDGGQVLFTWFPYQWFLDHPGPWHIDPTVVTTSTSATATAYSNQRKPERFSNGVLFGMFYDGNGLVCRYSTDNGQAWSAPTSGGTISGNASNGSVFITTDDCIHVVYWNGSLWYVRGTPTFGGSNNITGITWTTAFAVATVPSTDHNYPDIVVTIEGTDQKAHIVYSNQNSGNNYVKYARLNVTSGGTVTRDTDTQIGGNYLVTAPTHPSISVDANKNLYSTWTTGATGTGKGVRFKKAAYSSGSWTWGSEEAVDETYYAFNGNIASTLDDTGRFVVVYMRNTDGYGMAKQRAAAGGWSDLSYPAESLEYHSVTHDGDGNVFVSGGMGGINTKYRKYTRGTGAWSAAVTIASSGRYVSMRRGYAGNALDLLYTSTSGSPYNVNHHRISLNTAPTAPTDLSPNATGRDATTAITLTATAHDDTGDYPTDAMWELTDGSTTWYGKADSTLTTTPTWVPTGGGTFSLSRQINANQLTNGKTIQWRVKTRDQGGLESPYSSYAQFTTTSAPITSIVSPASGGTITTDKVTMQVSVSGSIGTLTYRLYADNAGAKGSLIKEHTGITSTVLTVDQTLTNNTAYWAAALAIAPDGVTGPETAQRFTVSKTTPTTPTVTVIPMGDFGHIEITVNNPAGGETVASNDVLRRVYGSGSAWTRIATGIAPNGRYLDYAVASGTFYEYKARAIGANGVSVEGTSQTAGITLTGLWMHDVLDPVGTVLRIPKVTARGSSWRPDGSLVKLAGRDLPVAVFGTNADQGGQWDATITNSEPVYGRLDATFSEVDTLARRRATLCCRDGSGRVIFGVMLNGLAVRDETWGARKVSIAVDAISYTEEV